MVETTFIAVWDADVFISPCQIVTLIERLQSNEAFITISFDWRVYLSDEFSSDLFNNISDIRILIKWIQGTSLKNGYHSSVGAFLTNEELYVYVCVENEIFIVWGHGDAKRVKRLEIMNVRVC